MANRTFCDSCGAECIPRVVRVQVTEQHVMSDGKQAAMDYYMAPDLCGTCGDRVKDAIGTDVLVRFIQEQPEFMRAEVPIPPY